MEKIRVAVVSVTSTNDKTQNIHQAEAAIREAKSFGAEWIALPEMLAFHGPYDALHNMAEVEGGDFCLRMSKLARELNIVLFAGTVGERSESQNEKKVFNTSFVFDRKGDLIARYRKIHLFNLSDATGKPLYCESDGFLSGQDIVTLDIDGFHVGLSICYDLRFASLYESMAKKRPLDVIMVPSAFTLGTGMYHWELLLRARAVEQLAYVVAPNQVGTHSPGKMSYGHAMIVDPWGTKICDTGSKPGIALANLSKDTIAGYRAQLPALANRRFDLY